MGTRESRSTGKGRGGTGEESVRKDLFERETSKWIEDENVSNQVGGIYAQQQPYIRLLGPDGNERLESVPSSNQVGISYSHFKIISFIIPSSSSSNGKLPVTKA